MSRQCTFNTNITEDRVIPSSIQIRAQIFHQFLLQRMTRRMGTLNQMVVVLVDATDRTVRTLARISAVKDVTNR